jgi:hypothetical protein
VTVKERSEVGRILWLNAKRVDAEMVGRRRAMYPVE